MEEWLHCNICCRRWGSPNLKKPLHFTTCKHVFCTDCGNRKADSSVCPYCKKPCNVAVLNGKIPPSIEQLFKSPEQLLKQVMEICQFHRSQRAHLMQYSERKLEQQTKIIAMAKQELYKNSSDVKRLAQENEELKKYIKSLPHSRVGTPTLQLHITSPLHSPVQRSNFAKRSKQEFTGKDVVNTPRSQFKTPDYRICNMQIDTPKSCTPGRLCISSPPVNGRLCTPRSNKLDMNKENLNVSFGRAKNAQSPNVVISPLVKRTPSSEAQQRRAAYAKQQSNFTPNCSTPMPQNGTPYFQSDIHRKPIFQK